MGTHCTMPFHLSEDNGGHKVPCGKCYACKQRRAIGWSLRLLNENKYIMSSYFVTLTYNTHFVPITKKGFMTLKTTDVQLFFKRLRKQEKQCGNNLKITYFLAGEYGSQTKRPHYHIIMYNLQEPLNLVKAWAIKSKPIGDIHVGQVTGASIGYCLKYISKEKTIPMHENDDRKPEFSLMSKRLGIRYLDTHTRWHNNDATKRCYIPLEDGLKAPMPRYYKDKIFSEESKEEIAYYYHQLHQKNIDEILASGQCPEQLRLMNHEAGKTKQKIKSKQKEKL